MTSPVPCTRASSPDAYGVEKCAELYDAATEPAAELVAGILDAFQLAFRNIEYHPWANVAGEDYARERSQFLDVGCGTGSIPRELVASLNTYCYGALKEDAQAFPPRAVIPFYAECETPRICSIFDSKALQCHEPDMLISGVCSFTLKHLLPRVPAWCKRMVAVDKSEAMLKFAHENHAAARIEYRKLDLLADDDVTKFVREQCRFQRVYSFLALHWIADQRHAMRNIETLIAPGGECFLVYTSELNAHKVFAAVNSPKWNKYCQEVQQEFDDLLLRASVMEGDVHLRSHAADLVRATSLTPLACEVFHTHVPDVYSSDAAADFFTLFNPIWKLLDDEEREELRRFTHAVLRDIRTRRAGTAKERRNLVAIHAHKPE